MLEDKDKNRIRLEELFRYEIQKEIEKQEQSKTNHFAKLLNQPFTLWFLSTIVLGIISFSYTQWQEDQHSKSVSASNVLSIKQEAAFRVRQIDLSLKEALSVNTKCIEDVRKDGKVLGKKIRHCLNLAQRVTVTSRLGGIIQFPPPSENGRATVQIGNSGYGYSFIPYKRGYRNPRFSNDSIEDLLNQYSLVVGFEKKTDLQPFRKALESFSEKSLFKPEKIILDWRLRTQAVGAYKQIYGQAYRVFESQVSDFEDELHCIKRWTDEVNLAWEGVKSELSKAGLISFSKQSSPVLKNETIPPLQCGYDTN